MEELRRLQTLIEPNVQALRDSGIVSLYLFGSRLNDAHTGDSDVDLFCDFDPNRRVSLFDLMDIEEGLEAVFNAKVDLISRASLHPVISQHVQATAIKLL